MNAAIEGRVLGFLNNHYTSGLQVNVTLQVQAVDAGSQMMSWEITETGLHLMLRERPDIHRILMANVTGAWERVSDQEGYFRFDAVPAGDWGYVVLAYDANGPVGQHTDPMGNDGHGDRMLIDGHCLQREGRRTNVIVPVLDRWYRDHLAEPCRTDPPTDPLEIIPGVREF